MFGKKIPKKAMAVAVGVVLSAASSMSVFASYIYEAGYRDEPCPMCHDTSVWVREEVFDPSPTDEERGCEHHRFGTDVEMKVVTLTTSECRECNYVEFDTDEYCYWVCCGFEMPNQE